MHNVQSKFILARRSITKSDPAGEVPFAETNPSAIQLVEQVPKRQFVRISDFAISIKSDEEPTFFTSVGS
jgi:hypothetical protein